MHERWKIANLCVINVVFTIQIRSRFVNMIFKPRHLQKCKTRIIVETRQVAIILRFFCTLNLDKLELNKAVAALVVPFERKY